MNIDHKITQKNLEEILVIFFEQIISNTHNKVSFFILREYFFFSCNHISMIKLIMMDPIIIMTDENYLFNGNKIQYMNKLY